MKKKQKESTNHHYLPRSILRNFSFDENSRLWIYDKLLAKQFTNTVDNVGSENEYNTILFNENRYNLEKEFQSFDDNLALICHKIIENGNLHCLTKDEYDYLYIIILVQMHRSPIVRSTIKTTNHQLNSIVNHITGNSNSEMDIDSNTIKAISLHTIFNDIEPLLKIIKSRLFLLLKTEKNYFITSDNAVVMIRHSEYENVSLTAPYTEIVFPISPNYAISLLPQILCNELKNTNVQCIDEIRNAVYRKESLILNNENVLFMNSAQLYSSKRFIYSNFELIDYLKNELQFVPEKKEKVSLYKIGGDALKANVRDNLHIVLYVDNFYYDYDIEKYIKSEVNQEILIVVGKPILDKYVYLKIPQMFIYEKKFPVIMIRHIVITKLRPEYNHFYYRIIPEMDFQLTTSST